MRKCLLFVYLISLAFADTQGRVVRLKKQGDTWVYQKKQDDKIVIKIEISQRGDTTEALLKAMLEYVRSTGDNIFKNGEYRQMAGFAIYENGNERRVYVADKKTEELGMPLKAPATEFRDCSHTERQLVIAAIADISNGEFFSSNNDELNSWKLGVNRKWEVNGTLYVYTKDSPCFVENGKDTDSISCAQFYEKIAGEYTKLTIQIKYDKKINIIQVSNSKEFINGLASAIRNSKKDGGPIHVSKGKKDFPVYVEWLDENQI